jgi:acyl-CoA synthetase (AMP-forming)/AMP-acid ligase II
LFDHIGGINTMLYSLFNGGAIVVIDDRSPETVLRAIARHEVETLPTSPTFINLLLLSQTYQNYDLSSLKTVTYGTEPMPESTLRRFNELFPEIRLQQTYGLSELGILQSRSKASDSLWVKIGGEGVEIRVVDGILHIKSVSVMLGYLNAESPFTSDGWFDTGDVVTVDGEYMLIHGRESEIINVGGEKVYPTEVESIIQEMESVQEVTVYGEKNAIIGNVVCAVVRPLHGVESTDLPDLVKRHCAGRLERFKVPLKVTVDTASQHGERFKKSRANLVDQR